MARPKAIQPVKRREHFINICVFGEPGVGKSVFAGTSPRALMLINDEDEASSPAEHGSTAQSWVISKLQDLVDAYEYVRHEGYKEFDWVWIDNLTLFQEQCMDSVMEDLVVDKPHRNRWVPDMHEYLVVQNQVSTYVRYFKQLPIHFGWTANVMRSEDEDGKVLYIPMVQGGQGQVSQKLCGYMNVVGHMVSVRKEGNEIRKLYVSKRSKFYAKSRWRGLQGELVEPTVPIMMDAIRSRFPALGQPPADIKTGKTKKRKVA